MAKVYSTPGVYIQEKSAFPNSIVQVASAVPCFIGFTEKAIRNQKSLTNHLYKISSFDEFTRYFGEKPLIQYEVHLTSDVQNPIDIKPDKSQQFYLYYSLKLYFNNGGGDCYIYSVGDYSNGNQLSLSMVEEALNALTKEREPTIIVIPDGLMMENASDYYQMWQEVLAHCRKMVNRFAILDIHGGNDELKLKNIKKLLQAFKNGIGNNNLNFGAVYWPWLEATVVQQNELTYKNIQNINPVKEALEKEAKDQFPTPADGKEDPRLTQIIDLISNIGKNDEGEILIDMTEINKQHIALSQASPLYKTIMMAIRKEANILPPSGAMAGIYKAVDSSVGTHQSPANISLTSVVKPLVPINNKDQEDLNVPLDGKAINAIRTFPGKGVLVWGARTMDGNSQDWRYISVRRTVSMIELSIKYAAEAFVFEPNDANTWLNLKAMITNFLTNKWSAGALAGATPESAFSVDVGLGTTMTPVDILDGIMRITVKIAVTRPAEFIVITFDQQMQTS